MSDAFIAFVRHEDKVLMMQRADGVADFPGAWDGVYGIGDPTDIDAVTTRIEEATGISAANLVHIRSAAARGLEFGNRLNDVTPLLFMSATTEVEPKTLYKNAEWTDCTVTWHPISIFSRPQWDRNTKSQAKFKHVFQAQVLCKIFRTKFSVSCVHQCYVGSSL